MRVKQNIFGFGQTKIFAPPWSDGDERVLVQRDPVASAVALPFVKNLVLSLTPQDGTDTGGQAAFRWKLRFGVGGGVSSVLVDAIGLQQLSLSADLLTISLVCNVRGRDTGFISPTRNVQGVAFFADGLTSTSQASYTEDIFVPAGTAVRYFVPPGATSWRVLGNVPAVVTSPWQADDFFTLRDYGAGALLDAYQGSVLVNTRSQFIPTARARDILVTAGANLIQGAIQWGFDL